MGLFDRRRGRGGVPDGDPAESPALPDSGEPLEEVGTRPPTPAERGELDAARAHFPEHAIDPADLASIATAYERALARAEDHGSGDAVEVVAVALGDHLVEHGGYRWVMSSDPFGTDLAVAPPRRGAPVVTRTLVAVRWMARESGWLTGVAEHLTRAGRA
ncbi:MAG: DUF3806 domain-containing protein [Ornithinibacter sp.]